MFNYKKKLFLVYRFLLNYLKFYKILYMLIVLGICYMYFFIGYVYLYLFWLW